MTSWDFYGRNTELEDLKKLIAKKQWFFCHIQGRRRIGKTTLIKHLAEIDNELNEKIVYLQIPDSDEVDISRTFFNTITSHDNKKIRKEKWEINNFEDISTAIKKLCELDLIVVLDEFQYFSSDSLYAFNSFLQKQVDALKNSKNGGLFILGSVVHEMAKLLDDSSSPLYGRITNHINLDHWDFEDLNYLFNQQELIDPYQWLSLWSFFEGVPKFYHDLYTHDILSNANENLSIQILEKMFLTGSSPLKEEVNNWFLRDIKGQQLSVIKYLGEYSGANHGDIVSHINTEKSKKQSNPSIIIKNLAENFKLIQKQNPVFSDSKSRNARYYINDNFLQAWLKFINKAVEKAKFSPINKTLESVKNLICDHEGMMFEKLIRQMHIECSKKGIGNFCITDINLGYWNKPRTGELIEIDLLALNDDDKILRFGSCKRQGSSHNNDALNKFELSINNFLKTKEGLKHTQYKIEKTLFCPIFEDTLKKYLENKGYMCYDLKYYSNLFLHK